jgi:hypothetical protein
VTEILPKFIHCYILKSQHNSLKSTLSVVVMIKVEKIHTRMYVCVNIMSLLDFPSQTAIKDFGIIKQLGSSLIECLILCLALIWCLYLTIK